jgi:hypothetical protein
METRLLLNCHANIARLQAKRGIGTNVHDLDIQLSAGVILDKRIPFSQTKCVVNIEATVIFAKLKCFLATVYGIEVIRPNLQVVNHRYL